jgi:hypothetical protein
LKEDTNGTAVAIAPAPPVTTVATVKKWRLVKPVLSATKHPLTEGVKHQEASLTNHVEFPVPRGCRTHSISYAARSVFCGCAALYTAAKRLGHKAGRGCC